MTAIRLTAFFTALVTFAVGAAAQNAPPTRLRGAIEAVSGNVITIKTREGTTEKVTMTDNWFSPRRCAAAVKAITTGT